MDHYAALNIDVGDPESGKFLCDAKDMGEIGSAMEVLTRVDLDLAYSSEKLLNLETLLMHVLAWENDFEAMAEDDISVDCIEKALTFDLLSAILDSEVRELDSFMSILHDLIVDARQKISSCGHLRELFAVVEGKLHDSEESLKQSQEHILEMTMQLAKMQMTSLSFNHNDYVKPHMQTVEHRHVLRMLEKSLARELDFEKKLTDLKQNEEDLKLKLRLTEQVAFCMEEAAEVVWGRFLEAENVAEVLMGTSKELVARLQIIEFNRNCSVQREDEMKSKLQDCSEQLIAKDTAMQKLNNRIQQLTADNSEVVSLREKVQLLAEQLIESESQLNKVNVSNEISQEQLGETESVIESLRENVYAAESRAESAEEKITQLTETNVELTEELGFLKGSHDSNTEKVSLLEKQVRGLEIQLQHARASSEASQEQQNMLYSAIWDMETLIDELKQKVSKSENKTDNAEEQCIILSETNFELNKELDFLRTRVECLETSLNEANVEKIASAKDINIKTNLIMDMVMQLATERERIKKQLHSLTKDNKILMEKLDIRKKDTSARLHDNEGDDNKEIPVLGHDLANDAGADVLEKVTTEPSSNSFQVEELSTDSPEVGTETTNMVVKLETERVVVAGYPNRMYVFMVIFILLLSLLAAYLFNKKPLL